MRGRRNERGRRKERMGGGRGRDDFQKFLFHSPKGLIRQEGKRGVERSERSRSKVRGDNGSPLQSHSDAVWARSSRDHGEDRLVGV